jgi:polyphosphate kinase
MSSADWMSRNLDNRIELLFEIYKDDIKENLQALMDMYWKDNVKSRLLQSDKKYVRQRDTEEKFNVQERLLSYYASSAAAS